MVTSLAKIVLLALELTTATSLADAGIHKNSLVSQKIWPIDKKCFWNNEKRNKRTKRKFIGMLLGTVGESLLGNMLAQNGMISEGDGIITVISFGINTFQEKSRDLLTTKVS